MNALTIFDALSFSGAIGGTICMVIWPMFPKRRTMLLVQAGIGAGFGLHYAIEGMSTAAALNGLGGLHVLVSLIWGTNPRLKWIGYSMIPLIALAAVVTWSGAPSMLSGAGMMLIALGRVQTDERRLRLLVLAGTPFWLLHDIMGASPLMFADALSIGMGLLALHKRNRSHKRTAPISDRAYEEKLVHQS